MPRARSTAYAAWTAGAITAKERTNASPNMSVECLFRIPIPATSPNQGHKRAFPVRMIRSEIATHNIQNTGSNAFMDRKLSIVR